MKKTAEIIYESLLLTVFCSLLIGSFLYTIQIKPKEIVSTNTVMGLHYKFGVPVIEKPNNNPYIDQRAVITDNKSVFYIKFNNLDLASNTDLCYIINEEGVTQTYNIKVFAHTPEITLSKFALIVNNKEYKLLDKDDHQIDHIIKFYQAIRINYHHSLH